MTKNTKKYGRQNSIYDTTLWYSSDMKKIQTAYSVEICKRSGRNRQMLRKEFDKSRVFHAGTGPSVLVPSILSPGLTVNAELVSDGDIQIDASVRGNVVCRSCVVGSPGAVLGNIRAGQVRVMGRVQGNISSEHVHLGAASLIDGDIVCNSMSMEAGARFSGFVRMSALARSDDVFALALIAGGRLRQ